MRINKPMMAGLAVLSTAAIAAAGLTGATAAGASTPHKVPVITVHMGKRITTSTGTRMLAGKVVFRVVTRKGDHSLQILRLHKGYSLQQAGADIGKAFGGNIDAIRRIDSRITWRGGAEARPNRPGRFATTLGAGHFVFLDQNSDAFTMMTVRGTPPNRAAIPHASSITAFSYGFGTSSNSIPATGWTRVTDQSDQPHFVVFQHVKARVTPKMVRRALDRGLRGNPPWVLRGSTSTGVMSPKFGETFHYSLPAGKYLIACFWPDDDTGMPHILMGMWKLIWLK
ncbi:MAG TPA: hypothetical protein VE442_19425 [Jatrophihabitans sp.]|jgi:hypothetical protein|nr:hypothetical protein [Jatrophihabitans sp.]